MLTGKETENVHVKFTSCSVILHENANIFVMCSTYEIRKLSRVHWYWMLHVRMFDVHLEKRFACWKATSPGTRFSFALDILSLPAAFVCVVKILANPIRAFNFEEWDPNFDASAWSLVLSRLSIIQLAFLEIFFAINSRTLQTILNHNIGRLILSAIHRRREFIDKVSGDSGSFSFTENFVLTHSVEFRSNFIWIHFMLVSIWDWWMAFEKTSPFFRNNSFTWAF